MATHAAWVAWQTEDREDGKPTKVPYAPNGRKARANAPDTWGTRAQAEARLAVLERPYGLGGIGIEFAALGDGRSRGGIDLDSCRTPETGKIEDWAADVIRRFASYTEVSPSGTGVKIFFTYTTNDLPKFQAVMGGAKHGRQFKRGGGDHPPAIELHLGNRFFAVTDDKLDISAYELRHVETELLLDLIQVTGPAFATSPDEAEAETKPKQRRGTSSDRSRSAIAFRKGKGLRRAGATYDEMVAGLLADPETADWTRDKGMAQSQRELRRIWEKAAEDESEAADPHLEARQVYQDLRDRLAKNDNGVVLATYANLVLILKGDPVLAGLVEYNAFSDLHMLRRAVPSLEKSIPPAPGPYPRPWDADDITRLVAFVQKFWAHAFKKAAVEECLRLEGRDNEKHDVRDYLAGLRWDSKPRLDTWLTMVFGCPQDDYHRAVGSKLLIAAVRRVRKPGCKFDHMVVLEGSQGILKSTVVSILFGADWTTDQISDLSSKDAAIDLRGKWGVEFSEIEQLIKNDVETTKAFLSRATDHYRPPYGRVAIDVPRQCVMIGTTNATEYLRDATGNRRIWPVKCLSAEAVGADLDWLRANRDQLWAEAAQREAAGESIWLDDAAVREVAIEAQAARLSEDPWEWKIQLYCESKIKAYAMGMEVALCSGKTDAVDLHMAAYPKELRAGFITVAELLEHALCVPTVQQTKAAEMRGANILRGMGWEKKLKRDKTKDNKPFKAWFPKDAAD